MGGSLSYMQINAIKILRSKKRRRTVSARMIKDILVVRAPENIPEGRLEKVVAELKAVEHILPIHTAQLLSYLKLSGKSVGLLINFHVTHLGDGITRLVNNFNP